MPTDKPKAPSPEGSCCSARKRPPPPLASPPATTPLAGAGLRSNPPELPWRPANEPSGGGAAAAAATGEQLPESEPQAGPAASATPDSLHVKVRGLRSSAGAVRVVRRATDTADAHYIICPRTTPTSQLQLSQVFRWKLGEVVSK